MNRTITWVAAALLALGACNKKTENPPPAPPAASTGGGTAMATGSGAAPERASAGSAAGSAAPIAAAATTVDVPTEMDFEDDATAKITDKNVETQVQAMEKELE